MFRLGACARVSMRSGSRLKTAAPFASYDGSQLPVTTSFALVAVSLLTNEFVGEFMRIFTLTVACIAAGSSSPASAGEERSLSPFTKIGLTAGGVYIAPGESAEVTISRECKLLTNTDERVGFYITPALHVAWPDARDRAPLEPIVTEKPCK